MPIDPKSILPQPVSVTYKDGRTETILVEQLSLRDRYKFLTLIADDRTPEMVALCTGKPVSWLDTLDDDSEVYAELVKVCYALNFQKALRLSKNDPVIGARLGPLLGRLLETLNLAEASMNAIAPGSSSSPSAPPRAGSAAETSAASGGSAQTP